MPSSEISTRHQMQTTRTSFPSDSLTKRESSPYACHFAQKTKKKVRYSFVGWNSTQHRNSHSKLYGTLETFGPFSHWKTKWHIDHAASMKELVPAVRNTSVKPTGYPIYAGMNIPPLPQTARTPPNTSTTTLITLSPGKPLHQHRKNFFVVESLKATILRNSNQKLTSKLHRDSCFSLGME